MEVTQWDKKDETMRGRRRKGKELVHTELPSNYKIAKINHKIQPAYRRYHKVKAERPTNRRIFLAFTTNHMVAQNNAMYIPCSRVDSPAERKLHGDFAAPFEMPL